jgi:hypothetical protein
MRERVAMWESVAGRAGSAVPFVVEGMTFLVVLGGYDAGYTRGGRERGNADGSGT